MFYNSSSKTMGWNLDSTVVLYHSVNIFDVICAGSSFWASRRPIISHSGTTMFTPSCISIYRGKRWIRVPVNNGFNLLGRIDF